MIACGMRVAKQQQQRRRRQTELSSFFEGILVFIGGIRADKSTALSHGSGYIMYVQPTNE